jgi:hypothetical protein
MARDMEGSGWGFAGFEVLTAVTYVQYCLLGCDAV